MIATNKQKLFDLMKKEGNSMFYSFNSKPILDTVRFIAQEHNGIEHYYNEVIVDYKPGIQIRLTYKFNDPIDNLIFRSSLIKNNIPYHTTGLSDTTYLEITSL